MQQSVVIIKRTLIKVTAQSSDCNIRAMAGRGLSRLVHTVRQRQRLGQEIGYISLCGGVHVV